MRCQFSQSLFGISSAIGAPVVTPWRTPLSGSRAVGFDRHPAAAAVAALAPAELGGERVEVDREAGGHAFEDRDERLAVRLAGSQKSQHSRVHSIRNICLLRTVLAGRSAARSARAGVLHLSSRMQLVADRFAVHEDGRAFDLATGARVTLIVGSAGGVSEQLRWIERCETLRALRHRAVAPLIDFGLVGESSRFEAWRCGSRLRVAEEGKALHARATQWLHACGMSAGPLVPDAVRVDGDGHGVWLPEAGTGYPHHEGIEDCGLRIEDCGLRIIEQPIVGALAEMFQAAGGGRPHVAAIWGPPGSGKRMVVGELARMARVNGLVPVAARLIESPHSELWRGRSLFVIAETAGDRPWPALVTAALRDPVSHVYLLVGEDECRSVSGVAVRRLPVDALMASIRPHAVSARFEQTVRQAAERSRGLPGRFVQLLWPRWGGQRAPGRRAGRSKALRVAEQSAVYGGGDDPLEERFEPAVVPREWPAPGELVALRRRMANATADVRRGLHAPGVRQLRQVVGEPGAPRRLERRGERRAGPGGIAAAARPDARRAGGDHGRTRLRDAGPTPSGTLARLRGSERRRLDRPGRLDEADSVLGAALAAARALEDPPRVAAVSLALARASYWRGEYADAEAVLSSVPRPTRPAFACARSSRRASRSASAISTARCRCVTRVSEDTAAATPAPGRPSPRWSRSFIWPPAI